MLLTLSLGISIVTDIIVLGFALYYLIKIHSRAKRIEKKEQTLDMQYHHVVDEALSKERKILDDATTEADQIITGAQYVSHTSKEEVDQAIQHLVADIQQEGQAISRSFTSDYTTSLKALTSQSLTEFQTIILQLQTDLQKQIKTFHESLLPEVEKELATYKASRIKDIDQTVLGIVQKASQEILNKSLSLTDHQNLVIASLEKAKKEGVFD